MEIKNNITMINRSEGNRVINKEINYIVIHYVGAESTAFDNTVYFKNIKRNASAHYFIDKNDIYRCVYDKDIAWHCASESNVYKHNKCRNSNSIGIELCCKRDIFDNWYFETDTIKNAILLTSILCKKYEIPNNRILRHYDVTGKDCPEPFVRNIKKWESFKKEIEIKMIPIVDWQEFAFNELVNYGIILNPEYWENRLSDNITIGEVMSILRNVYTTITNI